MTVELTANDDPIELARHCAELERPLLIGLDVDGVLAPIVAHADDAELLPGMGDAVAELADVAAVAVVSGRTVEDLGRFGFPDDVAIFGLHGMERRDERAVELGDHEQQRLARLVELASDAADRAVMARGWSSSRRASCCTCGRHIPSRGPARPRSCGRSRRRSPAPTCCRVTVSSSCSRERRARRGRSRSCATSCRRGSVVFVGDDRTDEEVFEALGEAGCSIRVGPGATAARHRLAGPHEVLAFLHELTRQLS